jgi:hypothetical protein
LEAAKVGEGVGAEVGGNVGAAGVAVHAVTRKRKITTKKILLFMDFGSRCFGWTISFAGIFAVRGIIIVGFTGMASNAVDNLFRFHHDGIQGKLTTGG